MEVLTQPCIIQSAFLLENGLRILVYTSESAGITSHHCDENFKPTNQLASAPRNYMDGSCADYHRSIRKTHEGIGSKLIAEHSTVISDLWH